MELNPLILPSGHLRQAQAASDVTIQYSYKAEELLSSISDQHHPWLGAKGGLRFEILLSGTFQ